MKRFFNRAGRDDYQNERNILQALSATPHPHIVQYLNAWSSNDFSYILLPLANGDLYHLLRNTVSLSPTDSSYAWLLAQTRGLCEALKYLHDYEVPRSNAVTPMWRVGFHHDLKPANILVFGETLAASTLKISDFGSGTIKHVSSTLRDSIHNRKASTGDPIYSAPEFVVEGRVSRPKDIWSLGCIFLEMLLWLHSSSNGVIEEFQRARAVSGGQSTADEPTFWSQVSTGMPVLNAEVKKQINLLELKWSHHSHLSGFVEMTQSMLIIDPKRRSTAADLCVRFDELGGGPQ